jgi:hypothetical protein
VRTDRGFGRVITVLDAVVAITLPVLPPAGVLSGERMPVPVAEVSRRTRISGPYCSGSQ